MHVLPEKKQTMFWLIIGTEITGIVVMIGLLAYKKFIADHFFTSHERKPAVSVSYTSRPTHSARPLFAQTRVESDTPVKIESVPAAAAVACVQSQPAEEAVPAKLSSASPDAAEPSTPEISDLNEQGDSSSWQIFSEENKSDKNSAAAGPPLPKVIKNPKIIVIKSRQILEVYDGGKLLRTYQASTGSNPGDKEKSGDRKTPEGEFYICVKNPKSRFVLSLGLSYPEYDDARRGLRTGLISQNEYSHIISELNMKRQPPWNTKLGGEVMIHGVRQGGRSTAGCIALENNDIRELYPRIPIGTKVIVKP